MENNGDVLSQIGQNRLEQVDINMPEVRFYFSGDREQNADNLAAYIGKDQLELQELQKFSETENGVSYYLLLDISASISTGEFSGITKALSEFCSTVRPQDQVVFLTFGEEVKQLFALDGDELITGQAEEMLKQLKNNDQRTLLFEAIHQMAELCDGAQDSESMRRVGFVITDGEDIATGKATSEEALKVLQENGIPVYGFAAASAARKDKNAFGEFSRGTGGYLTILEKGAEQKGFEKVRDEILQSYEAVFSADSNIVSHELKNIVLQFKAEEEKQQVQVMQERWIPDEIEPEIVEIVVEGPKQIRVVFSEPVDGADAAENFRLNTDTESLLPVFASPGSDKTSTVLSFSDEIPSGEHKLECSNLKDHSMEGNNLTDTGMVLIEAEELETPEESSQLVVDETGANGNGIIVVGLLLVLVCLAAITAILFRKRTKKVSQNGTNNVVLKDSACNSVHVSVEKKKLEEKQVYFHVRGQKEEIPIMIRKSMIVGRSSGCELVFDDPALSRQHFALELQNGNVTIQNLSQSGFTEVNGVKLGNESRMLCSGDEIYAGQLKLTIRW